MSNPSKLFTGACFLLLAILCLVELVCYFRWHSKAKVTAGHGEFLKVPSTSKFQKAILVIVVIGAIYWLANRILLGNNLERWVCILISETKEGLQRRQSYPRTKKPTNIMA